MLLRANRNLPCFLPCYLFSIPLSKIKIRRIKRNLKLYLISINYIYKMKKIIFYIYKKCWDIIANPSIYAQSCCKFWKCGFFFLHCSVVYCVMILLTGETANSCLVGFFASFNIFAAKLYQFASLIKSLYRLLLLPRVF